MIRQEIKSRIDELMEDMRFLYHEHFLLFKKEVLDFAFKKYRIKSFAELGCVWNVDCAYGIYALEKYHCEKAVLVDTHWTENARKKCEMYKEIEAIAGNFGHASMPGRIGQVDAIILFDVLLHQVAPDWDRILHMYSEQANVFIIVEPIFTGSPISVRLLDLGKDDYFLNTPHNPEHPTYKALFEKMYELHPDHNRIWRDVHHVWQWGITKSDLLHKMGSLGFSLDYLNCKNHFGNLRNFEYDAAVFSRPGARDMQNFRQ